MQEGEKVKNWKKSALFLTFIVLVPVLIEYWSTYSNNLPGKNKEKEKISIAENIEDSSYLNSLKGKKISLIYSF